MNYGYAWKFLKLCLRNKSLSKETMFKKEKCFVRNYVLESKEIMFKSL